MKNFSTLIAIGIISIGYSQSGLSRYASSCYEKSNYAKSSETYNFICKKNEKKGKSDYGVIRMAANSNLKIRDYQKAYDYFKQLIDAKQATDADQLSYIKLALMLNNSSEAIRLAKEYTLKNPTNVLCKELAANGDNLSKMKADSLGAEVFYLACNTSYDEFAPVVHNNGLLFSSNRSAHGVNRVNYAWDDRPFLDRYTTNGFGSEVGDKSNYFREINTKQHDGSMVVSKDGSILLSIENDMMTKNAGNYTPKLGIYQYAKESSGWSKAKPFRYNSKSYSISYVSLSEDGKHMYFSSDMPGGYGGFDIYVSELNGTEWSTPVNLGKMINTDGNEISPSQLGNTLYYSTDGKFGFGGQDVFSAKIESNTTFSTIENMGYPVNSSYDDFTFSPIEEGKAGYLASNRNGTNDDLYYVKITKTVFKVDGTMYADKAKTKKLGDAQLMVIDTQTSDTTIVQVDNEGNYILNVPSNREYELIGIKPGYSMVESQRLSTKGLNGKQQVIASEIVMKQDLLNVQFDLRNSEDGKPLTEVNGSVKSLSTGKSKPLTKGVNGKFTVALEPGDDYELNINQKGFLDLSRKFSLGDSLSGDIDIEAIRLQKIKKGLVFQVDNVLYKYNDFTLLEESKVSLDKLISFLKTNNNIKVEFSSHSDTRGGAKPNETLSSKRANSCVDYLAENGISSSRIVAKGYGESKPLNRCVDGVPCSEEEHKINRRTEIKILEVR